MKAASEESSVVKQKMNDLKKSKAAQLALPVSKPERQRMTRDAAYSATKEEVSKWVPLVKKNREADHLSFPANEMKGANMNVTTAALVSNFEAETELEKGVNDVLYSVKEDSADKKGEATSQDCKMDAIEAKLLECEELEFSNLSVAEIEARRAVLQKNRALMSYFEQKRKRANKIKSKKYHKIEKKRKERELKKAAEKGEFMSLADLAQVDPEAAKEEEMKMERQRAEERISLRHKTSNSKWAKKMAGRRSLDDDSREAINSNLALQENLRKKINDDGEGDDSDLSGSDIDESEKEKENRIENQILKLEQEVNKPLDMPKKGVYAMKFMQKAIEAKREAAKAALEQLRAELNEENGAGKEDDESDGEELFSMAGRRSIGAKAKSTDVVEGKKDSDDEYFHNSEDDEPSADVKVNEESTVDISSKFAKLRKGFGFSSSPMLNTKMEDGKQEQVDDEIPAEAGEVEVSSEDSSNPWVDEGEGVAFGVQRSKKNTAQGGLKSQNKMFDKGLEKLAKAERKRG